MKRERAQFRKKYPHLFEEFSKVGTIRISAVRTDIKEAEKVAHNLSGYEPNVIDFIRRCRDDSQALEIINFLEERGEIEPSYAQRLRAQLAERGLRSFGKRREPGWYEHGKTG